MPKRTAVPRASLACTILDDAEFITLMQTSAGRDAFALFCSLLAAAKAQDNKGVFTHHAAVVAVMVRWPLDGYQAALATLANHTNWVRADGNMVSIRSFKKWNSWGGKRNTSGKQDGKQDGNQDGNQDGSKIAANHATPVTVTVTGTEETTTLPPSSAAPMDETEKEAVYPPGFVQFWAFFPRKIGKGAAFKAWKRLSRVDKDAAIEQAEAYAQAYDLAPDARKQFFKHPATWLNARSWEDDHAEWALLIEGK